MPHKLLLADDSVTIQRVIELTFADEDIEVIAVGDGKQAIERINIDRPDIVLADVGMPERDGYDVATFIKQNPTLAHIPVVLLTGAFEPVDERRARAAGCDGVLVKPFEPQVVINRVRELLSGKRMPAAWGTQPPPTPPAGGGAMTPSAPSDVSPATSARAEGAVRTQAPPPSPSPAGSDSLDEYFDRLDAAFSTIGTHPPEEHAPAADVDRTAPADDRSIRDRELEDWDPFLSDTTGSATAPARARAPVKPSQPHRMIAPPPAVSRVEPPAVRRAEPPAVSRVEPPAVGPAEPAKSRAETAPAPRLDTGMSSAPLADAFAALLAAEQGRVLAPAASPTTGGPVQVSEALVEEVSRRVVERLSETVLRDTLTDVVLRVAERLVREEIEKLKDTK